MYYPCLGTKRTTINLFVIRIITERNPISDKIKRRSIYIPYLTKKLNERKIKLSLKVPKIHLEIVEYGISCT